jgi:hypothetical protein
VKGLAYEKRPLGVWFHERVLKHRVRVNRQISVPMWDARARGILWTCTCKKTWAR